MFDTCFSYILLAILIVILILNIDMAKNKNCLLLILAAIAIIGIMLIDNYNNPNSQDLENFNPNILAPVEQSINNTNNTNNQLQAESQPLAQSLSQSQPQSLSQPLAQPLSQPLAQQQPQQVQPLAQSSQLLNDNLNSELLNGIQNNTNNFDLKNSDYTLNVNLNDPKYNTNTNEPKKPLQAKDLLPGIVTNSKDKFDSFTDLFNYDKALELDIAENKLGIDTIQQSKRNASQDLREAPICPKFNVSIWNNSTIERDNNIKSLY